MRTLRSPFLLHGVCFSLLQVTVHRGVSLQLYPTTYRAYSRDMPVLGLASRGILSLLSPHCLAFMGFSHELSGCRPLASYLVTFLGATHVMGGGCEPPPVLPVFQLASPSSVRRPSPCFPMLGLGFSHGSSSAGLRQSRAFAWPSCREQRFLSNPCLKNENYGNDLQFHLGAWQRSYRKAS